MMHCPKCCCSAEDYAHLPAVGEGEPRACASSAHSARRRKTAVEVGTMVCPGLREDVGKKVTRKITSATRGLR